jgi:hypothetical protein
MFCPGAGHIKICHGEIRQAVGGRNVYDDDGIGFQPLEASDGTEKDAFAVLPAFKILGYRNNSDGLQVLQRGILPCMRSLNHYLRGLESPRPNPVGHDLLARLRLQLCCLCHLEGLFSFGGVLPDGNLDSTNSAAGIRNPFGVPAVGGQSVGLTQVRDREIITHVQVLGRIVVQVKIAILVQNHFQWHPPVRLEILPFIHHDGIELTARPLDSFDQQQWRLIFSSVGCSVPVRV